MSIDLWKWELLEYFGRRAPGGRDTNFCLGASKTGEYQGGPRGAPKGAPEGVAGVWALGPRSRLDPAARRIFFGWSVVTFEESIG